MYQLSYRVNWELGLVVGLSYFKCTKYFHDDLTLACLETRRSEFKSRSRQQIFRCSLQCQINMNLVFHISEDGSEITKQTYACIRLFFLIRKLYNIHCCTKYNLGNLLSEQTLTLMRTDKHLLNIAYLL